MYCIYNDAFSRLRGDALSRVLEAIQNDPDDPDAVSEIIDEVSKKIEAAEAQILGLIDETLNELTKVGMPAHASFSQWKSRP